MEFINKIDILKEFNNKYDKLNKNNKYHYKVVYNTDDKVFIGCFIFMTTNKPRCKFYKDLINTLDLYEIKYKYGRYYKVFHYILIDEPNIENDVRDKFYNNMHEFINHLRMKLFN